MVNVSLPFFFVRRSQMIAGMMPIKNAAMVAQSLAFERAGRKVADKKQHDRQKIDEEHHAEQILRAALDHDLLSHFGAGVVARDSAHACTRYAAARTLFTVVAAGGLARDGDLRHAAGKDFFYCCDLSHAVSFCKLA